MINGIVVGFTPSDLTEKIAAKMQMPFQYVPLQQFADGELHISLENPAQYAGKTVYIVQSTGEPVNIHTLAVAFLAHELKNAGAQKVIAVIPYLGYARQERSNIENKPGSMQVIARLFEGAGIDELVVVDLHDKAAISLFSIPVHNVQVQSLIAAHIQEQFPSLENMCLVAPDRGAVQLVGQIAYQIGVGTLIFSKERFAKDQTRVTSLSGSCTGTFGIVIDDMIATGGTALNVCEVVPERGYTEVVGYFVHPVFAGDAVERLARSCFSKIFVSNTLPLKKEALESLDITVFDVSSLVVKELEKI